MLAVGQQVKRRAIPSGCTSDLERCDAAVVLCCSIVCVNLLADWFARVVAHFLVQTLLLFL